MNEDRQVSIRVGLGLGVIVLTLLLLPLGLNLVRGGAAGVGVDPRTQGTELLFAVTWEQGLDPGPLDGRLLVIVARDSSPEPRHRVSPGPDGQQVFGLDVRGWRAGTPIELGDSVPGFPLASSALIPPGDYWVQGVLDRYQPWQPGGGPTVWLPRRDAGLPWNLAPGNLVSRPVRVRIDPRSDDVIRVDLSRVVPEPQVPDAPGLERVRLPSERLSAFWGAPVEIEAVVRVPPGGSEGGLLPVVLAFGDAGTGEGGAAAPPPPGPSALVVRPVGGSPFSPGWLPVDSENAGPWAEALVLELLPEVERRFGGSRDPGRRALYGGSGGGGWAALAAFLARPAAWAGVWVRCPAPLRLEELAGLDLHDQANAYHFDRAWGRTPRPGSGDAPAPWTLEQENLLELVLGSRGRSGGRWDAWQAAYSPRGEDGYPRPVWDKRTGALDPDVARAWRARDDLARLLGTGQGADRGMLDRIHPVGGGALAVVREPGGPLPCDPLAQGAAEGPPPDALAAILSSLPGDAPRGAP